ncbi:hypothetical protein BGX28_010337 [Mortierella sp. GBA30]|nr:hypothetical protein BGX28_010337 [Mortierella sp. GBA30]
MASPAPSGPKILGQQAIRESKSDAKENKKPKQKSNKSSKKSNDKPNKKRKTEPKPLEEMVKSELVNELERERPLVTLNMGTLAANARSGSLSESQADVSSEPEVIRCVKEAAGHAALTKRLCQRLIGQFLEVLFYQGMFEETDREWLDLLCPRVQDEDSDDEEEEDEDQEEDKTKEVMVKIEEDVLADNQCQFLVLFLGRIYSRDTP